MDPTLTSDQEGKSMSAMNDLSRLGMCTMPGCLSQAFWVHGAPLSVEEKGDVFPWELCNCCHESVMGADQFLKSSGLAEPDEVTWCWEATRARSQRGMKLEGLKKP
jgi:hypothetical protein